MRVSLSEIWNFTDIIKNDEIGWSFTLHAGSAVVDGIDKNTLQLLRDDNDFNTELLPEIFTFRDVLWQPDVFVDATMSLPSLRVLQAYCDEQSEDYQASGSDLGQIYAKLLFAIGQQCSIASESLSGEEADVKSALGLLRKNTFPIIKFFIGHPRNRLDYYRDAVNRLNYAVKIIITQFNGKYSDLQDPYWEVLFDKTTTTKSRLSGQLKTTKKVEKE